MGSHTTAYYSSRYGAGSQRLMAANVLVCRHRLAARRSQRDITAPADSRDAALAPQYGLARRSRNVQEAIRSEVGCWAGYRRRNALVARLIEHSRVLPMALIFRCRSLAMTR